MGHVTHMNDSMGQVAYMSQSYHVCESIVSHTCAETMISQQNPSVVAATGKSALQVVLVAFP